MRMLSMHSESDHGEEESSICETGFVCLDICDQLSIILLIFVCLLVLVLVLEFGLSWLHHREPWLTVQIEKECAMLGMISFFLFIVSNSRTTLHIKIPHDLHETIEFVHMALFGTMVFYLAGVAALAKSEHVLVRRWQKAERLTDAELHQVVMDLEAGRRHGKCISLLLATSRILFIGWNGAMAKLCQRRVKEIIIHQYGHLLDTDGHPLDRSDKRRFDHARYLQLTSQALIKRLMHVGPRAWLLLLMTFGMVFLPFDVYFWTIDGSGDVGHSQQYCDSRFVRFQDTCNCTLLPAPPPPPVQRTRAGAVLPSTAPSAPPHDEGTVCVCTGDDQTFTDNIQCKELCPDSDRLEWAETAIKNTALQSVFLLWSWLLCVLGQLVTTISSAR